MPIHFGRKSSGLLILHVNKIGLVEVNMLCSKSMNENS